MNRRLKSAMMLAAIIGAGYVIAGNGTASTSDAPTKPETYRLIHAIGNNEIINATGLTKSECDSRKKDSRFVAATIGVPGSITCLPESLFSD